MEKKEIDIKELAAIMRDDKKFIHDCIRSGNIEKLKERFEMGENGIMKPKRKQ